MNQAAGPSALLAQAPDRPDRPEDEAPSREAPLREAMELLFFGYRQFTAGPDGILADYGFGRAHHRVIYFVGRHPGITVSDLLAILAITKQSLSRVLRDLRGGDFVRQQMDPDDLRRRRLFLTVRGSDLERRLVGHQAEFLGAAFAAAGPEAVAGFRRVLLAMLAPDNRPRPGGG